MNSKTINPNTMRKLALKHLACLMSVVLLCGSLLVAPTPIHASSASTSPSRVNLTNARVRELNSFFATFLGMNSTLDNYDIDDAQSAEVALEFVLWYVFYRWSFHDGFISSVLSTIPYPDSGFININWDELTGENRGTGYVGTSFVTSRHIDALLLRYFDITNIQHQNMNDGFFFGYQFVYSNGRYYSFPANGAGMDIEHNVVALYDNGNGTYSARISIRIYWEGVFRSQHYNIAIIQPFENTYQILYWRNEAGRNAPIPTRQPTHNIDPIATASSWASTDITRAIELGIVPEALQNHYTRNITRAEFAALAVALYETLTNQEITGRTTFADTNDTNVQKAAYIGIISGTGNNNFSPNMQFNREQAAVMVSRLADAAGSPFPQASATFADNRDISSWAIDHVGQAQSAGIMGGIGNNIFNPQGTFTREQSIVTMLRLYDALS